MMHIEHGSFKPLTMSVPGGMSREFQKLYVRLSEMISEKPDAN